MKVLSLVAGMLLVLAAHGADQSPYAGEEQRSIKSMSAQEIESLSRGEGMGFAKAAELNRYPGPKHVLELADKLELSTEQRRQTAELFKAMQANAVALGAKLIAAEAELDRLFAAAAIDGDSLKAQLAEIGDLRTQLRFVHLEAHLQQATILDHDQVARYVSLRGYHGAHAEHH